MVDYKKMYYIMMDGSERAITAMREQNFGTARKILIQAERAAEELYIQTADDEADENDGQTDGAQSEAES